MRRFYAFLCTVALSAVWICNINADKVRDWFWHSVVALGCSKSCLCQAAVPSEMPVCTLQGCHRRRTYRAQSKSSPRCHVFCRCVASSRTCRLSQQLQPLRAACLNVWRQVCALRNFSASSQMSVCTLGAQLLRLIGYRMSCVCALLERMPLWSSLNPNSEIGQQRPTASVSSPLVFFAMLQIASKIML